MATPQWTIMLYLSGDNNLSSEMVRAINDIGKSGVPEDVNLAIQYTPVAPDARTLRYFLDAGTSAWSEPSPAFQPLPKLARQLDGFPSAASSKTLKNFIVDSIRKYDTTYRMLVLSGHGGGTTGDFLTDDAPRGRQPRSLTIPRLRDALNNARDELQRQSESDFIHVLGMDSCLMSMVEVCYELRHVVQYLVGSEGFVPNAGWPYAYLFEQLGIKEKKQRFDPKSISECIVGDYIDFYQDYMPASVSVDIAACELASLDGHLTVAVKRLADMLVDGLTSSSKTYSRDLKNKLILAHWRAQSYQREQNTDLWDFCDQLQQETKDTADEKLTAIADACTYVKLAVEKVVIKEGNAGVDTQYSHGLALYFPWRLPLFGEAQALRPYSQLEFPQKAGWCEFIREYIDKTRREPKSLAGGTLWPSDNDVMAMNAPKPAPPAIGAGATGKDSAPDDKDSAPDDKELADESRFLIALFGSGALPWSMKNPPQRVFLPPNGASGSTSPSAHRSTGKPAQEHVGLSASGPRNR
jgi:hypothetical protein